MHDLQFSPIRRNRRLYSNSNVLKYVFILPAALWIIAFTIFPFLSAINYTFVNYVLGRGITGYVGFDNYIRVLRSGAFWYSLFITSIYVSIVVPLELVLGFLLAWFVTLCPREHNFFRPILTAPLFTMEVAIGYLGITLFTSEGGLFAEVFRLLRTSYSMDVDGLRRPRCGNDPGCLAMDAIRIFNFPRRFNCHP